MNRYFRSRQRQTSVKQEQINTVNYNSHQLVNQKNEQNNKNQLQLQHPQQQNQQYVLQTVPIPNNDNLMTLKTQTMNEQIFTHQEVSESQVEQLKRAKLNFHEQEKKHLNDQITDLQMTLDINKGIICDLLQCKALSQVEGALIKKFNDENQLLKNRIKSINKELEGANAQILLLQQISNEQQQKEHENIQQYEEQITDLKDKLERKEYFMQNKERKWLEVEKILEEYVEEDEELRDKLFELRVNVYSNKKISNVVEENEKLKRQLDQAHEEISRLRKQILTMSLNVGKNKTKTQGLSKRGASEQRQISKKLMGIRKDGGIYTPNAKMIYGKKFDLNVAKRGGQTGRLRRNASYEEESRNTVRIYEDEENEDQDNDEEEEEENDQQEDQEEEDEDDEEYTEREEEEGTNRNEESQNQQDEDEEEEQTEDDVQHQNLQPQRQQHQQQFSQQSFYQTQNQNQQNYQNTFQDDTESQQQNNYYNQRQQNNKQSQKVNFLQTAPLNFYQTQHPQTATHNYASTSLYQQNQSNKLKIKESKEELKQYSHQLEEALAKLREKYIELEKDHETLNKAYLKQLKQSDRMQQTLNKVKSLVQQLTFQDGKLCGVCRQISEIGDLKKVIKERVFDISGDDNNNTMEQIMGMTGGGVGGFEMSFNNGNNNWKSKTTKIIQTRGQNNVAVTRSRQNNQSQGNANQKQKESPFRKIKQQQLLEDINRFSHIIPEEELDVKDQIKSPFLQGILNDNKISAIGAINDGRKDSPFWEQEQMYEFHNTLNQNNNAKGRQGLAIKLTALLTT